MSSRRALLESLLLSRLPSAFQEVEYIESTGTQYIDTNVAAKSTIKTNINFELTQLSSSSNQGVFGIYSLIGGNNVFYTLLMKDPIEAIVGLTSHNATSTNQAINTRYDISLESGNFIQNGTTYSFSLSPSWTTNKTIYLFKINQTQVEPAYMKLYSCKLYDNGTLVRDFVPCYRIADNVAGLYDLANGIFYTNAGTGTFIVGGNV